MKKTILMGIVALVAIASADLSQAAKPKKPKGVYCEQGGQNIFFPASKFPAKDRAQLRIGQKATINVAGIGPIQCRVY